MKNFPTNTEEGARGGHGRSMRVIRRRPLGRILARAIEQALTDNLPDLSPAERRAVVADAGRNLKGLLDGHARPVKAVRRSQLEDEFLAARRAAEIQRDEALAELSQLVAQVDGGQVPPRAADVYERRIAKLTTSLEFLERKLSGLSTAGLESGIASIYRTVQGLSHEDDLHEAKHDMLKGIFEANMRDFSRRISTPAA